MEIDGYIPADETVALETGVELNYKVTVGGGVVEFNFRAKSSGAANKAFQKASEKLRHIRSIRERTGYKANGKDDLKETLEVWYDHIILAWTTTAKSGGKTIKSTRDNFIEILSLESGLFLGVFTQLAEDCADVSNFTKEVEAEAVKN